MTQIDAAGYSSNNLKVEYSCRVVIGPTAAGGETCTSRSTFTRLAREMFGVRRLLEGTDMAGDICQSSEECCHVSRRQSGRYNVDAASAETHWRSTCGEVSQCKSPRSARPCRCISRSFSSCQHINAKTLSDG